ncbi:helix-turn-helix domain-containing protein [Nitrospirillum sp. BR 11164]|uniref:TetR/AcrR family transcriptional regulator n=1 Tax=Nitrospirillum sp. BR 11164 TaxID=3104324 RepID=UPI002AFEC7A0|nr:helix-turn-helix domain-containing protein [Nitrospirillum sp. BR 11164]MEA1648099.1 helix-turn-helix domain-containing protein [Nitrospirillum sp. BR 11164]
MRRSSRLGLRPLSEIAEAGLHCFTQRGFRLTQMSDIGAELGMSPSAAYRYVESKEALFHIAALHAAGTPLGGLPLPVAVSDLAETVLSIEAIVHSWPRWPALRAALDHPSPVYSLEHEAEGIATELYDFLAATWRLIVLFDRTANDIPSLKTAFTQQYRAPYLADIVTWFGRRYDGDGPAEALARSGIEAISWLAMRRRTDPAAASITEEEARRAAARCLIALLQAPQRRPAM